MIIDALLPLAGQPPPDDDFWYQPVSLRSQLTNITPDSAMTSATVFACVRVLSETIAQLPLHLMQESGDSRSKALGDSLYSVLHDSPNERHTAFELWEMLIGHLALRGNAYCAKKWNGGSVVGLVPLDPTKMQVFWLPVVTSRLDEGRLGYLYTDTEGRKYRMTQEECWHLRALSVDGLTGVSPVSDARAQESVSLELQMRTHGDKWFKNAAKPGGVLTMPDGETLDEESHKRLVRSWRLAHTGEELYKVAILEGGMKWQAMGLSNEDSQWLESRVQQAQEICRIFRVPPRMVGLPSGDSMTYSNVEQAALDFLQNTVTPWVTRLEQSIRRHLITEDGQYAKFQLGAFLRADAKTRSQFYKDLWGIGALSGNEIRELEDMRPYDGGDKHYVPANMLPVGTPPPTPTVQPPGGNALQDWVAYVAQSIAAKDCRELAERLEWGWDTEKVLGRWATTPQRAAYVSHALSPILESCGSKIDSQALATDICGSAVEDIKRLGPVAVLNYWRSERAEQLRTRLLEDLTNGQNAT